MKYLLLITLVLTSACSSWGNAPAQQFANVTYDENYIEEMVRARVLACRNNPKFCDNYDSSTKQEHRIMDF
jgi:hypothetical protein